MEKLPGAIVHGEAWKFFCQEMVDRKYTGEKLHEAWIWFLKGWKAKARQQDQLRNRR